MINRTTGDAVHLMNRIEDIGEALFSGSDARLFDRHMARVKEAAIAAATAEESAPVVIRQADFGGRVHGRAPVSRQAQEMPFDAQVRKAFQDIDRAVCLHLKGHLGEADLSEKLNKSFKPIALMIATVDLATPDGLSVARHQHDSGLPDALTKAMQDYLEDRHSLAKAKAMLRACVEAHEAGEVQFKEPDFKMVDALVKLDEILTARLAARGIATA